MKMILGLRSISSQMWKPIQIKTIGRNLKGPSMFFCSSKKYQNKKLSQMNFEQLLNFGSQQSLTIAAEMLVQLQMLNQQQQQRLKSLKQTQSNYPKQLLGLIEKENRLIQNIQLQKEDNKLIEKRVEKEIQDTKMFGISKIAKDIIQVADYVKKCKELAHKIYPDLKHPSVQQIHASEAMVKILFKNYQIEQFDPKNEPYDPNTQEALCEVNCKSGQIPKTVAQTFRTGYKIKGRLLRSAQVGVFR